MKFLVVFILLHNKRTWYIADVPAVTIASNSYSVLKTQNIELVCNIVANPAATSVQWYRYDGGVQSNLRTDSGKYNSPTVASPNLMINNADDQDRGYYICTATNLIGRGTSQSTFADVYGSKFRANFPFTCFTYNRILCCLLNTAKSHHCFDYPIVI